MSEHRMTHSRTGAKIKRLLGCLSLGMLVGCQAGVPNTAQTGALRISVQFPPRAQQDFETKLIRPETRAIYVAVYQHDLNQDKPQIYGPITLQNPTVRLNQLEAGEQTVIAAAYDEQNQILTAGESLAIIKANALSQASLELEADYSQHLKQDQLKFLQQLRLPANSAVNLATDLQPLSPNTSVTFSGNGTTSVGDSAQAITANPDNSSANSAIANAETTPVTSGVTAASTQRDAQGQAPDSQTVPVAQSESSNASSAQPAPAEQANQGRQTSPGSGQPGPSGSPAPNSSEPTPASPCNSGPGGPPSPPGPPGPGPHGPAPCPPEPPKPAPAKLEPPRPEPPRSEPPRSEPPRPGQGNSGSQNSGKDDKGKKDDDKSNNGNHYGADNGNSGKGASGNSGKGGGKND